MGVDYHEFKVKLIIASRNKPKNKFAKKDDNKKKIKVRIYKVY